MNYISITKKEEDLSSYHVVQGNKETQCIKHSISSTSFPNSLNFLKKDILFKGTKVNKNRDERC